MGETAKIEAGGTRGDDLLATADLLALHRTMLLIRHSEETLRDLFAAGEVPRARRVDARG